MALNLHNLDDRTRQLMLEEMDYDIAHDQVHISPFLSGQGQRDYANLLREAIQHGDDETLAKSQRAHRRITRALPWRKPEGGYMIAAAPTNAPRILAESEFNRFYIRVASGASSHEVIALSSGGLLTTLAYGASAVGLTNHSPRMKHE